MKGSAACFCLPVLILVLQVSLIAARPQAERSLLAPTMRAAGTGCADSEICSSGGTTTADCPPSGGTCPVLSAGTSCRTADLCSTGLSNGATQICPSDPFSNVGKCPLIPAGTTNSQSTCNAKDRCATSATTSGPCTLPTTTSPTGVCTSLPPAASCSSIAGSCTPNELCNAAPPKPLTSTNGQALYLRDDTQGTCLLPKPAGARCATGVDLCRGTAFPTLCKDSSCPMVRPGQTCAVVAGSVIADKCYNGDIPGAPCTNSPCPSLAPPSAPGQGPACYAGDACTSGNYCNAVGLAAGECTPVTLAAGVQCTAGAYCPARNVTLPAAGAAANIFAQLCPSTNASPNLKCPVVPAGQACVGADFCSVGTDNGVACTGAAAPENICAPRPDGTPCFATDQCAVSGQVCNAKAPAAGICVLPKAAGAACAANDLCATGTNAALGVPTPCPTSLICPVVPAGAACQVATIAGVGPPITQVRVADKCNNGNPNATLATSDCPVGGVCPVLLPGLKCTELADACVKGAKCQQGLCQPNGKIFAATVTSTPAATPARANTASTGLSTAATVPSVSLTATISNYVVGNFSDSVRKTYCDTIQQGILQQYNAASNCSTGTPQAGSVVVPTTIAFSGANSDAATAAQTSFANDLKSGSNSGTSVFGSSFGSVTVAADSVKTGTTANPGATSGAGAVGMAWTAGVALLVTALVLTV